MVLAGDKKDPMITAPRYAARALALILTATALGAATACGDDDDSSGVAVTGGETELDLSDAASAIDDIPSVSLEPGAPATGDSSAITLPVSGGNVDPGGPSGVIEHDGGIRLEIRGIGLTIESLELDLDDDEVTGTVAGRRIPVMALDGADVEDGDGEVVIRADGVTLTGTATDEINDAIGISLLPDGLTLGAITTRATLAE